MNQATPETWEAARQVCGEMLAAARDFEGINFWAMYEEPERHRLVNLAEYEDEAAWQNWIASNKPRGARLMAEVEVLAMEVYGELSPELAGAIASYASSTIYKPLD